MSSNFIDQLVNTQGVHCIQVEHERWCPGAVSGGRDCACNPDLRIVSTEEFTKNMSLNRAARRKQQKQDKKNGGAK